MGQNRKNEKELVIIGAGPGGYRAAFMADDLGLKVTLIDPEVNPGGECLYRGCIPTKALLHLVKIRQWALEAEEMGLHFKHPTIDLRRIAGWKNEVVGKLTGGLGQIVKSRKIEYLRGTARFRDDRHLVFSDGNGKESTLAFRQAIIATGTRARELPGISMDGKDIIGSTRALDLDDLPGHMLIIGGGYIGLEMATIYRGLGSRVSVTELTGNFMPGMDGDLVSAFKRATKELFEEIFMETSVKKVAREGEQLKVQFEEKEDREFEKKYDRILLAVGAKPDHSDLSPEKAGIETDQQGFIRVDGRQRTSRPNIMAIGDVTGEPQLAHRAMHQGRVAAEVAAGKDAHYDALVVPAIVYTEPEIAVCGLTENRAREESVKYEKAKFPWGASGRAVSMNSGEGFSKLLVDPGSGLILGAGIVGTSAGDLISEIALAIEMGATVTDLSMTIHPHPTLSETLPEAAEIYLGHPGHTLKKTR